MTDFSSHHSNDDDHDGTSTTSTTDSDDETADDISLTLENMNIRQGSWRKLPTSIVDGLCGSDENLLSSVTLNISNPYFVPINERTKGGNAATAAAVSVGGIGRHGEGKERRRHQFDPRGGPRSGGASRECDTAAEETSLYI